jgi:hypothetical protein
MLRVDHIRAIHSYVHSHIVAQTVNRGWDLFQQIVVRSCDIGGKAAPDDYRPPWKRRKEPCMALAKEAAARAAQSIRSRKDVQQ